MPGFTLNLSFFLHLPLFHSEILRDGILTVFGLNLTVVILFKLTPVNFTCQGVTFLSGKGSVAESCYGLQQ